MSGPVLLPGEQPLPLAVRSQASLRAELSELMRQLLPLLDELEGRDREVTDLCPKWETIRRIIDR